MRFELTVYFYTMGTQHYTFNTKEAALGALNVVLSAPHPPPFELNGYTDSGE